MLTFILVLLSSSIFTIQTDSIFISETAQFQIIEPGVFTEKFSNIETDIGDMEVFTFYCEPPVEDPNYLYLINYIQYPEGTLHHDSTVMVSSIFTESLDESISGMNGRLLYQVEQSDLEYPTHLSRAEFNEGENIMKSKMVVFENRFYFIQVFTSKEHSLNDKMDHFLDSFKLIIEIE